MGQISSPGLKHLQHFFELQRIPVPKT